MCRKIMQKYTRIWQNEYTEMSFFFRNGDFMCMVWVLCVLFWNMPFLEPEGKCNKSQCSCAPSLDGIRAGFIPRITHSAPRQILSNFGNVCRASKCVSSFCLGSFIPEMLKIELYIFQLEWSIWQWSGGSLMCNFTWVTTLCFVQAQRKETFDVD